MAINEGTGDWSVNTWPWPQVVFTSYYTIAFALVTTNLSIFELYCDTSDVWQGSGIISLGTVANIDHVDVADFGPFYAISRMGVVNNVVYVDGVIRNPGAGAPLTTALPTTNIPTFGTCCNFNGQGIIGCIAHGDDASFGDMGYNSVAWSAIGRYDFRVYDDSRQRELETTAGYHNMDWGEWGTGLVFKVKKLGKGVMVYGDGGKAFLSPEFVDPMFTFSKDNLPGEGIPSGNHIAGSDKIHGFIDNYGDFWVVDAKFQMQKLGYREYLSALTQANVRVSYAPSKKRFFISDGVTGYGLTEQGMYSTNQLITSAGDYRGTFTGFFADSADYEARIETGILDFNQRGFKTLQLLELGANYTKGTEKLQTSVKYKSDYQSNTFGQTPWIDVNPHGISTPMITASEFKLLAKGSDYRNAVISIDYLIARLKLSDKRNIRGPHGFSKTSS